MRNMNNSQGRLRYTPDEPPHSTSQKQQMGMSTPSTSRLISSYLSFRLASSALFVLVVITIAAFFQIASWQDTPGAVRHHDELVFPNDVPDPGPKHQQQREDLDELLHPEAHIHREPATFHHEWVITEARRRPDGVLKNVFLINGLFPGPVLEARPGDVLVVTVVNRLATTPRRRDDGDHHHPGGISFHWHGLYMRGQNRYDGAAGLTQNPIPPGANFTYEIQLAQDQWGTFWYHAHEQVQRADGLFGALVVHRPACQGFETCGQQQQQPQPPGLEEEEDRLLLVGDWYHRPAGEVLAWYMRAGSFGNEPVPDSLLVNGKGVYDCAMAVPARPVDCQQVQEPNVPKLSFEVGKRYRLRVVNHGSLAAFTIRTSGGTMRVKEVDGGNEVAPTGHGMSVGVVYPGQRVDLILTPAFPKKTTTDDENGLAYLEISLDRENFQYPNPALKDRQQFPVRLSEPKAKTQESTVNALTLEHIDLASVTALVQGPPAPGLAARTADITMVVYTATQKLAHLHNIPHGFMNQTTWKPQQQEPPAPLVDVPREQWDENQFVPQIRRGGGSGGEAPWVDVVVNNLDDGGHPFHLHGHDVYVLSSYRADRGWGSYNPFKGPHDGVLPPGGAYNLVDPAKRDTFVVPRRGYTVVRFQADKEGIWMFHCQVLWHQASGMAMAFEVV